MRKSILLILFFSITINSCAQNKSEEIIEEVTVDNNGKIISTNDAEKTAMLADELMKILAQKPVTSL